jgi:TetR/AcrR family transcriptional repressor of nem operon
MKVTKEQFADNRKKILKSAATLYRERGLDGIGIADIMADAGLTHGALYSHFESKAALAAAAFESVLETDDGSLSGEAPADLGLSPDEALARYLDSAHRDNIAGGCLFAAVGPELARQDSPARAVLADALELRIGKLAQTLGAHGASEPRQEAIATMAGLIGSLVMARIAKDPALVSDILESGRVRFAAKPR